MQGFSQDENQFQHNSYCFDASCNFCQPTANSNGTNSSTYNYEEMDYTTSSSSVQSFSSYDKFENFVLNIDTQVNLQLKSPEEEKKRLKNTEAARRCREKIKQRTVGLEQELRELQELNARKNHQRLVAIQKIGEQFGMLKLIARNEPNKRMSIFLSTHQCVQQYLMDTKMKRKEVDEKFARVSPY